MLFVRSGASGSVYSCSFLLALLKVSLLIGQLALWDLSHVRHRITGRHTDEKLSDVSSGWGAGRWRVLFVTEGA